MKKLFLLLLAATSFAQVPHIARTLSGVNPQTGTTYTFKGQDTTFLTTFSNTNPVSVTLPNGTTNGFGAGNMLSIQNLGPGTVTIACSGCLISLSAPGAPSIQLQTGQGVDLYSDGLNYSGELGGGGVGNLSITAGTGLTSNPNPLTGSGTISLLQALPNGETATTQPTGDLSLDVANDLFVQTAIASISPTPPYSGNQLISGGGVEWTGGLNFTVGAATYTIAGTIYSSLLTNETLATADPTNPRLDVIGVNNLGNVFVLTGVPAVTPSVPSVDPTSQLALTIILVPAASSTASVSKVDIYHENTEWVTSASGPGINLASTNNPYDGTVDIEATSVVTGNYAQMLDPLSATVQMQNYNNLVFYLRSKAAWPSTASLSVQWYNGTTPLGSAIVIRPTGTFGFVSSQTTAYQQISVATSLFGINGIPATIVRFTVTGTGGMTGWYMDDITLQGGQNGNPNATFLSWAGTWNATTGYNPNQVVFYNFTSWVCLVANTASTPSLTNTNWVPFNQVGSNQQVLFNDNGFWAGNAGMLFDKSTGNFTITGQASANSYAVTGSGPLTLIATEQALLASPGVGKDLLWADSTAHRWKMNNNNAGALNLTGIASAATASDCAKFAANGIDLVDSGAGCGTGSGSVTSVATTSPITGGTITTTGTIACATCVTSAASLTNKGTVIGGGGQATSTIDFPDVKVIPAANCNSATAGNGWSLPASNNPTAACRAGTNNLGGALQWANNNTTTNAQFTFELPADWDTGTQPYINIIYGSGANTSGTVKWTFSSACTKSDGSVTDDPAFNAESATTGKTMAVANRMWAESLQFTAVTSGNNCIAGSTVIVKITSGNGTATSTVNVYQATVTTPRLLTVQAN